MASERSELTPQPCGQQANQDAASAKSPVDVFVCYCQKDKDWKDWLLDGQKSPKSAKVRFWSDDEIRPSEDWYKEITNSLESAKVVVLLVSRSFLKSQFIKDVELPRILKRREANKAKILWVPLEPGMQNLQKTDIPEIQGVWPVKSPLKLLKKQPAAVLNGVRDSIHDQILRELDFESWRVRDVFSKRSDGSTEVIRRIGEGTSRTVYLGRDHALKRDVSIVTLKRKEDLDEFKGSLLQASLVEDLEVFITVYEASLTTDPAFYVRQYIKGQTLDQRLKHGSLQFRHARDIIVRLGKAVDAAHRRNFFHMNIKSSNILVDQWDNVFLSALSRRRDYFDWLKNNWGSAGADHPSEEDYAFAIPEFFLSRVPRRESYGKCDQYLLGLLGYHMITGKLPVRVSLAKVPKSLLDFDTLAPIQNFEGCQLCPKALADSIMRMVSSEPSERFDSVGDAIRQLEKFGEQSLTLSKESYRRVATVQNWESKVFERFYAQFIPRSKSKKAQEMFKSMNMGQQYEMLKEAVLLLLVFCEFDAPEPKEPTVLSRIATKHSKFDLELSDLDLFQTLLIEAFVRQDPECENNVDLSKEVTQAWRKSLQPGIQFMKRHLSR